MSTPELLAPIAVVLPCWYVGRRCISREGVEINHVATFSFGFLFYWTTPLVARIYFAKVNFLLASLWISLFRASLITPYALACIGLYICFVLGDSLGLRLFRKQPRRSFDRVPRLLLSGITLAGCLLLVYTAFVFRGALFRQATPSDLAAQAARGAVTSCVVLLGTVCLILTIERPQIPWRKRIVSGYFLPFLAGCVLLLLLGSRLYVASLLVMFAIWQTNLRQKFKLSTVVAAILIFAFFFGAVGTWREQSSITGAYSNVVLEPMLNSISLAHYLRYKGISWINAPKQLMMDLLNLTPSLLFPNKFEVLKKPKVYQPVGGLHSFVSFNLNFGLIGTAVFWFLMPMGFRYLKSRLPGTLPTTIYIMCSAWLMFTFFRDAFSISLVKAMLESSILIPLIIIGFGSLLNAACSPRLQVDGAVGDLQAEAL